MSFILFESAEACQLLLRHFSSSLEEDIKHFVISLLGKTTRVIKAGSSNLFFFFFLDLDFSTEMILCNRNTLLSEPNKYFGRTNFKC